MIALLLAGLALAQDAPDPHGSPAPPTTEQPAPDGPDDGLHTVDDAGSESTETDAAVPDPAPSDPPETPEPDPTEPVPDANPESPEPHAAPEPAAPEPHVAPEPSPHAAPEPQPAPGPAPQPVPAAPAPQPRPAPITDLFGFFPEPPAPAPRDLVLVPQSQPVANPLAPVLPEIAPRSFWFAIGRLVLAGLCGLLASLLRWASRDLRSSGVLPRVLSVVELLARLAVAVFLLGALAALVPESLAPALPIVVIAAAFAMGWSARDVLHDLVAGVFLLVEGQLRAGSWIRGERYSGTIEAIGVRVTWLRDVYGRRIIVPNRVLLAQPLVADDNPWPRIQFTVAMPTDATTDAIRSALEEAIIVSPWVAPQPDCEVHPDGIQAGHWHIAVRLLDSQYADRFQGLLRERVEEILPPMTGRPLLLGVAVAGALLGFVLEPLVGRLVTLSFGGAVHVWAVCMLVFQTVLLLAYVWAHFVARRFPLAHAGAVLAGLASLPLHVDAAPDPAGSVLPLVGAVLLAVGLPYFGLASAAVVAQSWVQRRGLGLPWELYAASNLGSLVGLFAYPLVVEPLFGLSAQRMVWSAGYVAYAGLVAVAAWTTRNSPATTDAIAWPAAGDVGRWVLLACAPSVLLLAVTGWIGTEFGSFPLLWTVPLGLYLGSFMVAFSERVPDAWLRPFWPDALVALALFACLAGEPVLHALLYTAFFAVCWQVHAALYRAHPEPAGLTVYYLAIALGGWIGGLFVSLIAPNVFPGLWELPIGLALCAVALLAAGEIPDWRWFTRVEWRWAVSRGALVGTMALLTGMWLNIQQSRGPVASVRSLYGVFQVRERAADDGARFRELMHGGTSHGSQYLPPDPRAKTPMSYYHPEGSNAEALARRAGGRVAGIGLGTGAIAGLMRPGEHLVFYELDPNAETLARGWFTYLADSPAQVEVRMGDARLVLAAEDTTYDALFVDAFSGDGIPTHLLTIEAFEVYLDRLAPDGVLVLHISNRFLDLRGVVRANAETLGLKGAIRVDGPEPGRDPLYGPATSMILTRSDDRLIDLSDQWIRLGPLDGLPRHAPWTDERLDLLEPLGVR